MTIYGSNLHAAARFDAAGAILGNALGVSAAAVVASTNQYTITWASGYQIDINDADVEPHITGATPGSVTIESQTDTTLVLRTWSAAGAAAALPFNVKVRRRFGSGAAVSRPPYGSLVASANVQIPAGVPTVTGRSNGVTGTLPTLVGAGIVDVPLAGGGLDQRDATISLSPADPGATPGGLKLSWVLTGDNTLRVSSNIGGTPTTAAFQFVLERYLVGA